jgi:hypothetical protein
LSGFILGLKHAVNADVEERSGNLLIVVVFQLRVVVKVKDQCTKSPPADTRKRSYVMVGIWVFIEVFAFEPPGMILLSVCGGNRT